MKVPAMFQPPFRAESVDFRPCSYCSYRSYSLSRGKGETEIQAAIPRSTYRRLTGTVGTAGTLQICACFCRSGWNSALERLEHPPAALRVATDAYEQESDPLADFLEHACDLAPDAVVRASELFDYYRTWSTEQGHTERERLSAAAFGRRIGERFERGSDKRGKFYRGIARRVL